jgi:hypothetical protein
MTTVAEDAPDVNTNSPLEEENTKNSDWRKVSPAFARKLNPKRPDYSGSALFNELILWTRAKTRNRLCRQNQCYRSIRELEEDCPCLSGGIEEAIDRLKKKLGSKLTVTPTSKCHWFTIDQKLINEYERDKGLWFRKSIAGKHGILKAVLHANLEHQVANDLETNGAGIRYGELSPVKLTKPNLAGRTHLPWPEDSVKLALKEMRTVDQLLIQHPTKKTLYTLAEGFNQKPDNAPENENRRVVKTDSRVAKTDTWVARTDTFPGTEVTRSNERIKCHSIHNQATAAPAPGCANTFENTEQLNKLIGICNESIANLRINQAINGIGIQARVTNDSLPYDYVDKNSIDLPYDIVPVRQKGVITFRDQEIEEAVNSIKTNWRIFGVKYTKNDLVQLHQLFVHNPAFQVEHWQEIESAIALAQFEPPAARGDWDNHSILRRVKTAKARLQYLPQIIHQMFIRTQYDKQSVLNENKALNIIGEISEPFKSLEFSCVGDFKNSKLVGDESPIGLVKFFGSLPDDDDYNPARPDYLNRVRALRTDILNLN